MQFDTRQDLEYRIFVGSLETVAGEGFLSAVIVERTRVDDRMRTEIFRNTALFGGHRFVSSGEAMHRAFLLGEAAIAAARLRLSSEQAGV